MKTGSYEIVINRKISPISVFLEELLKSPKGY